MYNGFIQSTPFTQEEFNLSINSDHAEISCTALGITIGSMNISNRYHHHYFQQGPFRATHLNTDKKWLKTKHLNQILNIQNSFANGTVDIWVIQEAYIDFLKECANQLDSAYRIYHKELDANDLSNPNRNITAIIVNTLNIQVKQFQIIYQRRVYPVITVYRDDTPDNILNIVGVHVQGNAQQYPEEGISQLLDVITKFHESDKILAIGDFNTVPDNIRTSIQAHPAAKNRLVISDALYPTHINPNNQIASYDNIVHTNNFVVKQDQYGDINPDSRAYVKVLLSKIGQE